MRRLTSLLSRFRSALRTPRSTLAHCNPKFPISNLRSQIRSRRLFLEPLEDRSLLATFTVVNTNDSGAGSLRDAIVSANNQTDNDIIDFSPGVTGIIKLASALPDLSSNIQIQGPGANKLTVRRDTGGDYRILTVVGGPTVVVGIDGLTLSNGYQLDISGSYPDGPGGAIANLGCALTVTNSTFAGNTGGSIYNTGTMTVTSTTFDSNTGAILSLLGTGGILNSDRTGSGIYNANGGMATVNGSTFSNNIGSGIFNNDLSSTVIVNDSTFSGNHAGAGGGIFLIAGLVQVNNSTFSHNTAAGLQFSVGGGISLFIGGTLEVSNSTFSDNQGGHAGGGLSVAEGAAATVSNCTFSGNSANYAGGIFQIRATLTVTNSTLSGNTATFQGGGIWSREIMPFPIIRNTIIAGNTASTEPDFFGPVDSEGHNLIGNITGSSGWIASDLTGTTALPLNPLLAPLANNGGPTQTMALLPTSPAINGGSTMLAVDADGQPLTTDQRGSPYSRIYGTSVDIGAFEFHPLAAPGPTLTVNSLADTFNPDDGNLTLREAIAAANGLPGDNIIDFSPGLTGTINIITRLPSISSNVQIEGPGTASLTLNRSGSAAYGIFEISPTTSVEVSGLTISNAVGGIRNAGTLSVTDCTFTGNTGSDFFIAAVPTTVSIPIIASVGSGIYNENGGSVEVRESTFFANSGSAIFTDGSMSTVMVSDSTFTNNDAGAGAGIYNHGGTLHVMGSTFSHNTAGGNYRSTGGGIVVFPSGVLEVSNSTFVNNQAGYNQAGQHVSNGYGGAIGVSITPGSTAATITNCTISGNQAASLSGGVFRFHADLTLNNSILANNTVADPRWRDTDNLGSFGSRVLSGSHNLIYDSVSHPGLINTITLDPELGPLASNGGPTQTMALLSGSPAIDTGNTALLPADTFDLDGDDDTSEPIPTDQRGLPFDRIHGAHVDIGAYESPYFAVRGTVNADSISVSPGSESGTLKLTINGLISDNVNTSDPLLVLGFGALDTFTITAALANGMVIDGGEGADVYDVSFGQLAGTVNVVDSGTAGSDRLTVRGTPADDDIFKDATKVTLGSPVVETVLSSGIETRQIRGGGGDDLITDPGSDTELFGDDGNDTIIIADTTGLITADGGEGSDTYIIYINNLQGPVSIDDTGTTGTDTVTLQGTPDTDTITQTGDDVVANGATIKLIDVDGLTVDGGGGSGDSFTVVGTPSVPAAVQINGTGGDDNIHVIATGQPGEVKVYLNNVAVGTFQPTDHLIVHGLAGNDWIQVAGGVTIPVWLYGDEGDDRLNAGNAGSLLFGGDGNDELTGGNGRDVLIGGEGADKLNGNGGDDLLIAGSTSKDASDSDDHNAFWSAVLAEWNSPGKDSSSRVAKLKDSGGLFPEVIDDLFDDQMDLLNGAAGEDWLIFALGEDKVAGKAEASN